MTLIPVGKNKFEARMHVREDGRSQVRMDNVYCEDVLRFIENDRYAYEAEPGQNQDRWMHVCGVSGRARRIQNGKVERNGRMAIFEMQRFICNHVSPAPIEVHVLDERDFKFLIPPSVLTRGSTQKVLEKIGNFRRIKVVDAAPHPMRMLILRNVAACFRDDEPFSKDLWVALRWLAQNEGVTPSELFIDQRALSEYIKSEEKAGRS